MSNLAYQEHAASPYKVGKEVVDVHSGLGFIAYGGDEGRPAEVVPYSEGLIRSLRKRYSFRGGAAVRDFLYDRPYLIQLLFAAAKEIRNVFGSVPSLALSVVADPEALEEQELFLFIQTTLHPKAARPLLDELSRKWWLDAMLDAKGEMNISLEYL